MAGIVITAFITEIKGPTDIVYGAFITRIEVWDVTATHLTIRPDRLWTAKDKSNVTELKRPIRVGHYYDGEYQLVIEFKTVVKETIKRAHYTTGINIANVERVTVIYEKSQHCLPGIGVWEKGKVWPDVDMDLFFSTH